MLASFIILRDRHSAMLSRQPDFGLLLENQDSNLIEELRIGAAAEQSPIIENEILLEKMLDECSKFIPTRTFRVAHQGSQSYILPRIKAILNQSGIW